MDLIDLLTPTTLDDLKAKVAGFASLLKLKLDSWAVGDPAEQLYTAFTQALKLTADGNATIFRGFVLDYATDPGDDDPFDARNATLPPSPGFLSKLGLNEFFTERIGATKATGNVTLTNTTGSPVTITPLQLTFADTDHPEHTYRNSPDASIYTGVSQTLQIAPSGTVVVPYVAETAGSSFSIAANKLARVQAPLGVTVADTVGAIGIDREAADLYRARCRGQAAGVSPNGASDGYRRLANTNFDGTPLLRSSAHGGDDMTPVGITRIYASQSSSTGVVTLYFADDDGGADSTDAGTANDNIELGVIATPGCITYSGTGATNTPITVTWAVLFQLKYKGKTIASADVKKAINDALTARFKEYPIGGFDQTAGAGTIYASDLRSVVERSHPAIYKVTLSNPGGDTAIPLGHVPTLNNPTGTETGS